MYYTFLNPDEIIGTPEFKFVARFLRATGRNQLGWHYVIDLAWIYSQAKNWPTSYRILDAGGGGGPTQFLLAELGFDVTNLDLYLIEPKLHLRKRYRMKFVTVDSYEETDYVNYLVEIPDRRNVVQKLKSVLGGSLFFQNVLAKKYQWVHERWRRENDILNNVGRLSWIKCNLCNMPEIASNSFDAVVSLSALEHIPIECFQQAWTEIKRVCKPGADMAITTSATERGESWFHQPSRGICFSERDLNILFGAEADGGNIPANCMISRYRRCSYLKDNLANYYFVSGENGMPWGKWEPAYFPVGIFR